MRIAVVGCPDRHGNGEVGFGADLEPLCRGSAVSSMPMGVGVWRTDGSLGPQSQPGELGKLSYLSQPQPFRVWPQPELRPDWKPEAPKPGRIRGGRRIVDVVVSLPVKPALATFKAPRLDLGWSTGVQSPARSVRVKTAHQANPQGTDMNGSCVFALHQALGPPSPDKTPPRHLKGTANDAGPLRLQCRSAPNIDQKQLARDRHTTVLFNPGLTSHLLPLNPINPPKHPHPPDHNPPRNPHRPPHPLPLLPSPAPRSSSSPAPPHHRCASQLSKPETSPVTVTAFRRAPRRASSALCTSRPPATPSSAKRTRARCAPTRRWWRDV